jgi:hypothetical protein
MRAMRLLEQVEGTGVLRILARKMARFASTRSQASGDATSFSQKKNQQLALLVSLQFCQRATKPL